MVPCHVRILDPSVDRPKLILFQHGPTSKIILKNFSINIHELGSVAANRCIRVL